MKKKEKKRRKQEEKRKKKGRQKEKKREKGRKREKKGEKRKRKKGKKEKGKKEKRKKGKKGVTSRSASREPVRATSEHRDKRNHSHKRVQCQLRRVSWSGMERAVLDFTPDAGGAQDAPNLRSTSHSLPAPSALCRLSCCLVQWSRGRPLTPDCDVGNFPTTTQDRFSWRVCAVALTDPAAVKVGSAVLKTTVMWAPRETNREADALANVDTSLFNPALRLEVRPADPMADPPQRAGNGTKG